VLYELRHTAAQLGHELDKACPQFDAAPPAAVAPPAVAPPAAHGAANGAAVNSSAAASPAASVTTTREDTSPVPPATAGRADDGGAEPLPWASFSNSRVWT